MTLEDVVLFWQGQTQTEASKAIAAKVEVVSARVDNTKKVRAPMKLSSREA